jgi:hypothetical protein
MRNLIIAICVSFPLAIAGCSDQTAQTSEAETYPVKLVFQDLDDQRVTLTIDGDVAVDDVLHDNHDTPGVTLVKTVQLKPTSRFHLRVNELIVDRSIVVNTDTKLIYINPHERPFIETSNSEVIMLD